MVKKQALVGESGNRKLPGRQAGPGQPRVKRPYKKRAAIMSVSVPVRIMNLQERKYGLWYGHVMRYSLPLPRLKTCSMYLQRAKADENRR